VCRTAERLYGSDAIGGRHFDHHQAGSGPPKVTGSIEAGSFGTDNEKLGLSGSTTVLQLFVQYQPLQSDTPVVPSYMLLPGQKANDNSTTIGPIPRGSGLTWATISASTPWPATPVQRFCSPATKAAHASVWRTRPAPNRSMASLYARRGRMAFQRQPVHDDAGRLLLRISTYVKSLRRRHCAPRTYVGERLKFDLKQDIVVLPTEKFILGASDEYYSLNNQIQTYSDQDRALRRTGVESVQPLLRRVEHTIRRLQ